MVSPVFLDGSSLTCTPVPCSPCSLADSPHSELVQAVKRPVRVHRLSSTPSVAHPWTLALLGTVEAKIANRQFLKPCTVMFSIMT